MTTDTDNTKQAWDRREGETSKQWLAFTIYRDLPPEERSQQKAWSEYCRRHDRMEKAQRAPNGTFKKWTRDNDWLDRAQAYDTYLDEQRRSELEPRMLRAYLDAMDVLLPGVVDAARSLVEMAAGNDDRCHVRRQAAETVLNRAGVSELKRLDVTSKGERVGQDWQELRDNLDEMDDDELARYAASPSED